MFEIIEDCSPYYIKFRHSGLEKLISDAKTLFQQVDITNPEAPVIIRKLEKELGWSLLNMLPYKDLFKFQRDRVAYIVSTPGSISHTHIDGASISFNYGIDIRDQECITRWYDYAAVEQNYRSKSNMPFDRASVSADQVIANPIEPLKFFSMKEGECVLFNADLYHSVDNSRSTNPRTVLTFRLINPGEIRFDDAKKILFNK